MVVAGPGRLGVAVAVACGALAGGAHAASVSLVRTGVLDPGLDHYELSFHAAPGEANRLTMSQSADGLSWSFHDAGAVMVPGANCAAAPDATGSRARSRRAHAQLQRVRDDAGRPRRLRRAPPRSRRRARDEIDMGSGDDALTLHAGSGLASLGPGRDTATADAGSSRSVDGGTGSDATGAFGTAEVEASYGSAPGPVSVSLDGQANDGTAGEGDDVGAGVARIFASAYDDVLDESASPGPVRCDRLRRRRRRPRRAGRRAPLRRRGRRHALRCRRTRHAVRRRGRRRVGRRPRGRLSERRHGAQPPRRRRCQRLLLPQRRATPTTRTRRHRRQRAVHDDAARASRSIRPTR